MLGDSERSSGVRVRNQETHLSTEMHVGNAMPFSIFLPLKTLPASLRGRKRVRAVRYLAIGRSLQPRSRGALFDHVVARGRDVDDLCSDLALLLHGEHHLCTILSP